jgi:hypothetical protein
MQYWYALHRTCSIVTFFTGCYVLPMICRIVTPFPRYAELLRSLQDMKNYYTFFTGYAELLHSSQDMYVDCYILHMICRNAIRSSQDIKKRCVLHMMCRNATLFTGYAELLSVSEEVPVMHSPQDMQDTELQLSPPQGIGEGHLVTLTFQERVCIAPLHCTRKFFANCRFVR